MMTDISEEAAVAEVSNNNSIKSEQSIDLSEASKKLTEGLLFVYKKPLEHIKQELSDLTSKQESCITQIQLENKKLCYVQEDIELNDLFSAIEAYQNKLVNIKKEILTIHERTAKLKKRALKYQQIKQKEALHKELQQEL